MITITTRLKLLVLIIAIILLLPLVGMQFSNEINWSVLDFTIAGILFLGAVITIEFIIQNINNKSFKILLVLSVLAFIVLIWLELAVGIFGTPLEGN